ncbi:alpha/beta hydrolase [Campylobacter sp. M4]|uniref:alpha/beta hydrolase n=1 Tax=Campylobacter sp. M4 TaxID=3424761 RepID=UPI003D339BE4
MALNNVVPSSMAQITTAAQITQIWDKTFTKSDKVEHKKVTFKNHYGISLVGDLYTPKNLQDKAPVIIVSGPFGAVKEQSSGLHAHELAKRGFITLAFDPSFTGESSGEPRGMASPDINSEDVSAAVDFVGLLPNVDREKIGVLGICGFSGMSLTAATSDTRIKAVATTAMYDMSSSIGRGMGDGYTKKEREAVLEYINLQRWEDAKSGTYARNYHEVPVLDGKPLLGDKILPETLGEDPHPVLAVFFDYYRTKRGYHARSLNSNSAWLAQMPTAFFQFKLYDNIKDMNKPVLFVNGENSHSLHFSKRAYEIVNEPKELVIVPNAHHVDLYDNYEKIPFDKFEQFFRENLK